MSAPDWTSEYMQQIEDCEARESRLTAWDVNFLESIKSQLGRDKPLSTKQIDVLDSIWERATKKG